MSTIGKLVGLVMALGIVLGLAAAGVPYNSDVFGKGAPYISVIDPTGDKITVTNPGDALTGRVIFVDAFGRHVKTVDSVTLNQGENVFDVNLPNVGNIGIHTAYYVTPTAEQVALGELGLKNNDDLAMYNIVNWLPASNYPGKVYQRGQNGIWGWVTKQ